MLFFSCYVLCQNPLPSGTWLLQWHLMLASMDIVFKGLPNIPGRSPLTSPSSLPPVCHAVTFSQRHTVTLFSGSHAGVRCVSVRIAPTPRYIWIKSLPNLNLSELWWSHFAHICARACDRLIFFWFQLEQESCQCKYFYVSAMCFHTVSCIQWQPLWPFWLVPSRKCWVTFQSPCPLIGHKQTAMVK